MNRASLRARLARLKAASKAPDTVAALIDRPPHETREEWLERRQKGLSCERAPDMAEGWRLVERSN